MQHYDRERDQAQVFPNPATAIALIVDVAIVDGSTLVLIEVAALPITTLSSCTALTSLQTVHVTCRPIVQQQHDQQRAVNVTR